MTVTFSSSLACTSIFVTPLAATVPLAARNLCASILPAPLASISNVPVSPATLIVGAPLLSILKLIVL